MLTEAEAIVNSDAILKGFRDTYYIKTPNHINDSFEVFCDVETGSVICKNKNCYRYPTLKICQHCFAIFIKTDALETFFTNYNKTKNISLGRLVEFDKEKSLINKKTLEKRREKRQKKERGPQIKTMYQLKRSYTQSSERNHTLQCQQLIHFRIVMLCHY